MTTNSNETSEDALSHDDQSRAPVAQYAKAPSFDPSIDQLPEKFLAKINHAAEDNHYDDIGKIREFKKYLVGIARNWMEGYANDPRTKRNTYAQLTHDFYNILE